MLAVKGNQPKLHAAISDHFLTLHETDFAGCEVRRFSTTDDGPGRLERRYYDITALPESMHEFRDDWTKLTSIGQAVNITIRDGKEVCETRHFILSLSPQVKRFAAAVRGHWGIENSLHWTLDMTFREDESRIRKDHGPENFAILRRAAWALRTRFQQSKSRIQRQVIAVQLRALREQIRQLAKA